MHPPVHGGCVCAIIPLYEDYWVTDEKMDDLGLLVNADRAFVDERKLTQYSLDKESQKRRHTVKQKYSPNFWGLKRKTGDSYAKSFLKG